MFAKPVSMKWKIKTVLGSFFYFREDSEVKYEMKFIIEGSGDRMCIDLA